MTRQRSEIDARYKWKVDSVYESDEEWGRELEEVREHAKDLEEYQGRLSNPEMLLEFLKVYSDVMRRLTTLSKYASMKSDEDTREQKYQGMESRVSSLSSRVSSRTSFVENEVQDAYSSVDEMVGEEPGLEEYGHYLHDILRLEPHTPSTEVSEVLSDLSDVLSGSSQTYSLLMNADLEFPSVKREGEEVQITPANFTTLLKDEDRELRREVHEKFYNRIVEFENTVGSTFSNALKKNIKRARIREYETAREAALDRSNVPVEVYDNLVESVRSNLDALHDHLKLKREVLDVDELGMHDVYMPLAESESPEIEFERARKMVLEAVQPLGDDYVKIIEEAFEERWIDVYENRGKRSGAYSGGSYDTAPFILMNYQGDLDSVYTLAHELGHSAHSYLACKNQNYLNSSYGIFVAEVASTVNEELLTRHLLKNMEDENIRAHALSHSLENFRTTLYRQTMFADFEARAYQRMEEEMAITPEEASELYTDIKSDFYSPAKLDEHIRKEWMRIPHFYYNFYVFQYSTGISAANQIAENIVNGETENYLEMLKKGGSMYPLELLEVAGVDMSSPEPVKAATDVYRRRQERMRQLID